MLFLRRKIVQRVDSFYLLIVTALRKLSLSFIIFTFTAHSWLLFTIQIVKYILAPPGKINDILSRKNVVCGVLCMSCRSNLRY